MRAEIDLLNTGRTFPYAKIFGMWNAAGSKLGEHVLESALLGGQTCDKLAFVVRRAIRKFHLHGSSSSNCRR